jgi:hypothetical protein
MLAGRDSARNQLVPATASSQYFQCFTSTPRELITRDNRGRTTARVFDAALPPTAGSAMVRYGRTWRASSGWMLRWRRRLPEVSTCASQADSL